VAGSRYVLDNAVNAEPGLRFAGLEATFDPSTIRYLTSVGVTDGWVCWELPAGRYDLIHARLVLSHLPQRRDVLARLVQALRPGGWLVVEDFLRCLRAGQ
jgi:2-polyprenyl-3-methyl-5-hydroxy-6-metoxy-1,4-benzoquinol methylase